MSVSDPTLQGTPSRGRRIVLKCGISLDNLSAALAKVPCFALEKSIINIKFIQQFKRFGRILILSEFSATFEMGGMLVHVPLISTRFCFLTQNQRFRLHGMLLFNLHSFKPY